jgi:hypothetical protein
MYVTHSNIYRPNSRSPNIRSLFLKNAVLALYPIVSCHCLTFNGMSGEGPMKTGGRIVLQLR